MPRRQKKIDVMQAITIAEFELQELLRQLRNLERFIKTNNLQIVIREDPTKT